MTSVILAPVCPWWLVVLYRRKNGGYLPFFRRARIGYLWDYLVIRYIL
jgi:hypothetical protein